MGIWRVDGEEVADGTGRGEVAGAGMYRLVKGEENYEKNYCGCWDDPCPRTGKGGCDSGGHNMASGYAYKGCAYLCLCHKCGHKWVAEFDQDGERVNVPTMSVAEAERIAAEADPHWDQIRITLSNGGAVELDTWLTQAEAREVRGIVFRQMNEEWFGRMRERWQQRTATVDAKQPEASGTGSDGGSGDSAGGTGQG